MNLFNNGTQGDILKRIRERVDAWRAYPLDHPREPCPEEGRYEPVAEGEGPVSETTRALLRHWFRPEPHRVPGAPGVQYFKYWPHQRRTIETFIYLHEVCRVRRTHDLWRLGGVEPEFAQRDPWAKLGAQLATGAGKTKVMSLVAAWSILNALREKTSPLGLGRHVLIIAPGLFVRDRLLQDFLPAHGRERSVFAIDPVIPPSLDDDWSKVSVYSHETCPRRLDSRQGAIVVTNYHRLLQRSEERASPRPGSQIELLFEEDDPERLEALDAPLIERFAYSRGVTVINDEAHYVWDEPGHQWFEERQKRNPAETTGDEAEVARAWIGALRRLHGTDGAGGKLGLQIDLSATLFEEAGATKKTAKGAGGREGVTFRPPELFRHTAVRYDLREAVQEAVVKRPVLEHITARNKKTNEPEALLREGAPNAWEKYRNLLEPGIRRWRALAENSAKEGGRKPILFILCDNRHDAAEVANHLRYGEASREDLSHSPVTGYTLDDTGETLFVTRGDDGVVRSTVTEVHIGKKEQSNEKEWAKVRAAVNLIDRDAIPDPTGARDESGEPVMLANTYNVVVSVMMLKEGWDVRNVRVIVPLRPCNSRTLTEQVLGRGLRRMHPPDVHEDGSASMGPVVPDAQGREVERHEKLYVMEHPSFQEILTQIDDLVELEGSEHIAHSPEYVGVNIKADPAARAQHDVRMVTYGGQSEVVQDWRETFDVGNLPTLSPRRAWAETFDETEIVTRVREAARQVEFESEGQQFTLPAVPSYRDFDHLVGVVYVRPLLSRLKKSHQHWNAVRGVVKDYLERRTFDFPASLPVSFDRVVEAGNGKVAMANLARPDVSAPVIEALLPALREAMDRRVTSTRYFLLESLASDVKPYQAARRNVLEPLRRSVFTCAAMDSADERRVAALLDRCEDVTGWVYNHQRVGYSIEFEWQGRVLRYIPDFLVRASIRGVEHNVILEVKGRFDDRDKAKARRGLAYAEQLTVADGRPWHYLMLIESPPNNRRDITDWAKRSEARLVDLLRQQEVRALYPDSLLSRPELKVLKAVAPDERYRTAWPVFDLVAAAGAFGVSQAPEPVGWMRIGNESAADRRCFVARMKGVSMLPHVPDGAWVLFRRWDAVPPPRALDGRRVLVQLRDADDPDTGGRYTVKRWKVIETDAEGSVTRVELRPDNPDCETLTLTPESGEVRVVAELVRVIGESEDLWDVMRDLSHHLDARTAALAELVAEGHPDLPAFLASSLEREDLAPPWRDALIFAAEQTQVPDVASRTRLMEALWRRALTLRDTGEAPLWSAIRRYASMAPVEESGRLLEFLQPDARPLTLQVTMQSLVNIFGAGSVPRSPATERILAKVHAVALERIDPSTVRSPEDAALAFCCYQAAAALDDPALDELSARLEQLGRRRLTERAAKLREELALARTRGGGTR